MRLADIDWMRAGQKMSGMFEYLQVQCPNHCRTGL